jgi:hypothetical protein
MRTFFARSVFMCALAGLCASAFAQITITADDVRARLNVGSTITNNDDTLATAINIGSLGLTSWDFSALKAHNTMTLTSVAKPTPFDATFPGATHALKTSLAGSIPGAPGPVKGDLYLYVTVGANLLNPGNMGSGTVTVTILGQPTDLPGELKILNTPPDTTYALPSTLGTAWGSTYTSTTSISVNGIALGGGTVNHAISYVVDAYGPMKMPDGKNYSGLRIRKEERGGSRSTGYIFLSKEGASVQLTAADTAQPRSGTIQVSKKSVSWSPAFISPVGAVEFAGTVPGEFALQQNYPNPFNPSTTIMFQVAKAGYVSLKVYDLLGQEVATLVNETKAPGTYSVDWLAGKVPSGIYFYRMQSGSFTATRSMMLIK